MPANQTEQPALRAVRQGLFPTMESLQSVVELGHSQLPITNANQLTALLMTYHNTLLHVQQQENKNVG
jgi:hypothetical protein